MMHCPGYRCPQSQVDYSFQRLLDLVSDRKMVKFRDNSDAVASLHGVSSRALKIQNNTQQKVDFHDKSNKLTM